MRRLVEGKVSSFRLYVDGDANRGLRPSPTTLPPAITQQARQARCGGGFQPEISIASRAQPRRLPCPRLMHSEPCGLAVVTASSLKSASPHALSPADAADVPLPPAITQQALRAR
ncbi:MAG: hypothetical protein ACI30W_08165 [Muribaculaceae bacterium]